MDSFWAEEHWVLAVALVPRLEAEKWKVDELVVAYSTLASGCAQREVVVDAARVGPADCFAMNAGFAPKEIVAGEDYAAAAYFLDPIDVTMVPQIFLDFG